MTTITERINTPEVQDATIRTVAFVTDKVQGLDAVAAAVDVLIVLLAQRVNPVETMEASFDAIRTRIEAQFS